MGFGYLFLGYLIAFVLYLTANALRAGVLALIVGYALMLRGTSILKRYCPSFRYAEWTLWVLLLPTLYRVLSTLSDLFLWDLPWLTAVAGVAGWVEFLLLMTFHAAMLMSVRELATEVGLPRTASFARWNLIVVALYAFVYLATNLPIPAMDGIRTYFTLSLTLLNLLFVILDLILLLSCNKDICREGEEEPPQKRYRWDLLNRIGDGYARTQERAVERKRENMETFLRRRQERKNRKNNK